MDQFESFFARMLGKEHPHPPFPYQRRLAEAPWPETLVIPTGFGKTAAVLAAWLWKVVHQDPETPRRLIYCLPMRTLVEQTEAAGKKAIGAAREHLGIETRLDILMGGRSSGRRGVPAWMLELERPTLLIGTQDLLVSAALMRGYGASRFRWPVDFALLNNDALWVFDEVQLTGAALPTSAQLEAFRRRIGTGRACRTLWMSATLDPDWLRTVDFAPADRFRPHDLSAADLTRAGHLWAARKYVRTLDCSGHDVGKKDGLASYAGVVAKAALDCAKPATTTIVFLNTVARAQAVYQALANERDGPELLLVHSRFRKAERQRATDQLLSKPPPSGRIVVATQALEAGIDVTSATMISEIAPWSSLVQRFGRCNRYGECGETGSEVIVLDLADAAARPYEEADFIETRHKLAGLTACGPADLAAIPPSAPPRRHVIRRRDLYDLFDTDPDLSGFDVDVSLYVRDADDTDVRLFWRGIAPDAEQPADDSPAPAPEELCPAPIGGTKELLGRKGVHAWRWDTLGKEWRAVGKNDVFPGLVIWIDAKSGGYHPELGFLPSATAPVEPITLDRPPEPEPGQPDERDSISSSRVSLARHSAHVRDRARALCDIFGLSTSERDVLVESALWHDLGKAHEAFVALTAEALSDSVPPPLAKWPSNGKSTQLPPGARRYFRHELASALAYLKRRDWAEEASLGAYLIAAHHGKVRMRLRALPNERPPAGQPGLMFARGVHDGDLIPETHLDGLVVPETVLNLDLMQLGDGKCGPSWSARTQSLLEELGPFRLAWLEAFVRIADWQASKAEDEANRDDL